jgi:uncharacterized membrane protein
VTRPGDGGRDRGSVLPLLLAFVVIAVALVTVVTDASRLYLDRRALRSVADQAALAGVQQIDRAAFYASDGAGDAPPLDPRAAVVAVQGYVDAQTQGGGSTVTVEDVEVGQFSVTVTVSVVSRLPFSAVVGSSGVTVKATSTARAPYAD